jgi:O-antigen/teichoic acid export membrane protein
MMNVRLYRAASGLLLARWIGVAGSAVATAYLARKLEPNGYGLFALVSAITSVLALIADCGLSQSSARFLAENVSNTRAQRAILCQGLLLKALLVCVAGVVFWYLIPTLSIVLGAPRLADLSLLILFLLVFAEGGRWVQKTFEGLGRVDVYAIALVAQSVVYPILAILFVWIGWGVAGALTGLLAASGICLALAVVLVKRLLWGTRAPGPVSSEPITSHGQWRERILRYTVPLAFITAGSYVFQQSDFLLIQYFVGSSAVGFYHVQFRVISLLLIPAAVLAAAVAPSFSARAERSTNVPSLLRQCLRFLLLLYVPAAVGVFVMADTLVEVIFGSRYLAAVGILRVFALCFLPARALGSLVSLILNYQGRASYRAKIVGIAAVVNIALNIFLIPRFGILGAAVATQITYLPVVALYLVQLRREIAIDWRAVSGDAARIVAAALLMGFVVWIVGRFLGSSLYELCFLPILGVLVFGVVIHRFGLVQIEDVVRLRRLLSKPRDYQRDSHA